MRIVHCLLFILLGIVTTKTHQKHHQIPIQGQHFFSETEKSASYTLTKIQAKKPLVVILKNKNDKDLEYDAPLPQPVTITISDDSKNTVNCTFKRMNDMCRLQSVKSKTNTIVKQTFSQVRVACQEVPCDVMFESFQPEITSVDMDKQTSFEVYRLYNVSENNTILEFLNNDTQIEDFGSLIRLFTRAEYEIFDDGNVLMFVFKEKLEDFFVEADPRVLRHSQMRLTENAYQVDFGKMERSLILNQRVIHIKKMPQKELRLQMSVTSTIQGPLKPFNITFYGFKAQNKTEIIIFNIVPDQTMPNSDISIVLKHNQISQYELLTFKVSTKQDLMLVYQLNDTDVHAIEVEEESYFFLEKGQTINYEIVPDPKSDQKLQVYAGLVTDEGQGKVQLKLSENPCYYYKGCKLQITSKEDTQAGITVSLNKELSSETKYIPLEKSITIQLFQGDRKYLLFNTTTARDRIVSVSTSNVLIYASTDQKCKRPSKSCSDYLGNSEQPIAVENLTGVMYITVQALELVRVTIRIDDKDSLFELEDGVPLTYNMRKAKEVYFTFKIKSKKSVNFNLIAPLNSFVMVVSNSAEKPDSQDVDLPSSGSFVKFQQDNIQNLVFTVLIKRNTAKTNEDFVIIASTNNAIITLDRAEPHYDLVENGIPRYFAVLIDFHELDSGIDTMLNLHVFQLVTGINMTARFGSSIKKFESDELKITKSPYLIDLNKYSQKLCQQQSDESACHVFIELVSHNEHSLDITLSVVNNDSIIKLRSGIWQSFVLSELTSQNHFIFVPTNKRYPINLQFSHSFGEFKLAYTLWNNKLKEANSGKWPFPEAQKMPNLMEGFFQGSEYMVTASEVEKCYPDCILLISLWGENKGGQFSFGSYRIMASDDLLELLQQHKISITLALNETKSLLIDLKHYIQTDKTLTILTSSILGYHDCTANLLTNKNMTLPTERTYDYRLDSSETQWTMEQLRTKLEQKKLNAADDVQMVIYCRGYDANRFIIEFTTKQNPIQKLMMGIPQTVIVPPHSEKYFSTEHYMNYRVKVVRVTSFPQIAYRTCNHSDLENCYQKLASAEPSKITDKVEEIREKYCAGCLLLIRVVSGDEKVVLEMVTMSEFTAIQLKEAQVTSDILSANSSNLYKIHTVKNQNIVLTVTVFEGNPTARVFNTIEGINKSSTKKGNVISITVSAAQFKSQQTGDNHNKPMLNNYAFSQSFSQLIVEITDTNQNCSYSITYSLGERSLVLQDGVLSSANLKHNETVIFNYHNYGSGMNSIVAISFGDSDMLDACEIKYSQVIGNEEPVIESPAKLEIKKKVPRPTLTFHLSDNYSDYEIIIRNTKTKEVTLNIIINHQDIILLPYNFEYPSFMGANQTDNLIVWAANEGYMEFIVKKCSSSDLSFAYALDDDSYQKDEFNYETAVEEHIYTAFIKVHVGSIYIRLHSNEGSLYSITANHYTNKKDVPATNYKPGNKGVLEYVVTKDREVEVSFTPIQCKGKCPNITYYYLLHESQENVVNQVSCPGSFFLFQQNQVLTPVAIHPEKASGGKLKFNVKLDKEIEFLGVKGVMDNNREVAYPVIEIATFWGGVQKNRHYLFLMSGLSVLCILFCIVMQLRRRNRMKYQILPDSFDPNA